MDRLGDPVDRPLGVPVDRLVDKLGEPADRLVDKLGDILARGSGNLPCQPRSDEDRTCGKVSGAKCTVKFVLSSLSSAKSTVILKSVKS